MAVFQKSVDEVARSKALRAFGAVLLLTVAGTGLTFITRSLYRPSLGQDMAICWPFNPLCRALPIFDGSRPMLGLFMILMSIAAMPLFAKPERVRWGMWALAGLSLLKWMACFASYAHKGNYHYISLMLTLVFLLAPGKKELLQLLMVGVYVSSSFLKYGNDWLSGAALLHPNAFLPYFGMVPLYLAAPIEGSVSWLLLSTDRRWRYFALAVMVSFHLVSIVQVGFFFPVLMLCHLTIFPLVDWEPEERPILDRLFGLGLRPLTWVIVGVFASAQILPRLLMTDLAMSGLPRVPALTMLDARVQCETSLMVETANGYEHITNPVLLKTVRSACDPMLYLDKARRLCEEGARRVSFEMRSRRTTGDHFVRVLNLPDACDLKYPLAFAELFNAQESM